MQQHSHMNRWLDHLRAYRNIALDTNVIIYALQEVPPYWALIEHLFRMLERGYLIARVSTLVEAEVLVKPLQQRNQIALEKAEMFFSYLPNLVVRTFDRAVARRAALVRATSHLRLPDAAIVATALEERCDVLIGNDATMELQPIGIPYLHLGNYI